MALGWVLLALVYLGGLFWLGRWGDRGSPLAQTLTSHPLIYSLALGIYCTAWTYFGAVGEASRNTWQYLPILLGPTLVYVLGYRFILKLTLVSKRQHITTIADFIASRYGKRQTVAMLVTLIALLATIPYVALQLKAIGSAFVLVSDQQNGELVILIATVFIALFSIYFGTQRTDVTEYRRGLMLTIAFESCVKLIALLLIGGIAYFWLASEGQLASLNAFSTERAITSFSSFPFLAQTLMAAAAVICLPRQFHVAVIDNLDLAHIKTARWAFPLFLMAIAVVIPVIATAGEYLLSATGASPDTYVLNLAQHSGVFIVEMLVFIGGLSAATAMIIVATLTLSTMLTNDVILPRVFASDESGAPKAGYTRTILMIRRLVIGLLLLLAYLYHQQLGSSRSLASIGLIAFSLVVHLLPAVVGGLYWKKANAAGFYAGLLCGLITWVLWLVLSLLDSGADTQLRNDMISQGAIFSLAANIFAYVLFSLLTEENLLDRIQAQAFVTPKERATEKKGSVLPNAKSGDLLTLLSTFMGETRCQTLLQNFQKHYGRTISDSDVPTDEFIAFCERALGGVLGGASAKALLDSTLRGKKLGIEEVVTFFDDTTEAIRFNATALFTSIESLDQGISVVDKHLNLVAWNKRYLELFEYPEGMIDVGVSLESLVRYNADRGECGPGEVDDLVSRRMEHVKHGHAHRFLRQRSNGQMIEMIGNPLPGGGYVTSFSDVTSHIEIQQALKEANIDLENRIRKRSEEVQAINAELRSEINRRAKLEEELVRARQAAEDANDSKTRFLALASHDVLQPLNAAKLYLSALGEMTMPKEVADVLLKLGDSVTSSEALIATLLDIARLDQEDMLPSNSTFSLARLLAPLTDEFAMKAERKGLQLRTHIQDLWVHSDKTYVYRIVQNLLSNAVKYTQNGKVLLSVRRFKGHAMIQVWDTGEGIADAEQKRIFSDFYRVGGSLEHGVGLGLGVVRRLADKLGVPLSVKSRPGLGSCFALGLKLTDKPVESQVISAVQHSGLNGLRILCIDDKQANLDAMQLLLDKWGIETAQATNGAQAKSLMQAFQPNALLVDYQLGEKDNGIALIGMLRKMSDAQMPAALVTADQEASVREECEAKDIGFLNKPVKPAKLRMLLNGMQRRIRQIIRESVI